MLEDLHDDLSKLAKVKLVEESSGETSFLVDGAALRLRERVSVARGKLQGHWGIVRDIRADSLSLIFERCGDDSCPGQLVCPSVISCYNSQFAYKGACCGLPLCSLRQAAQEEPLASPQARHLQNAHGKPQASRVRGRARRRRTHGVRSVGEYVHHLFEPARVAPCRTHYSCRG
jgi:hypothetical protein